MQGPAHYPPKHRAWFSLAFCVMKIHILRIVKTLYSQTKIFSPIVCHIAVLESSKEFLAMQNISYMIKKQAVKLYWEALKKHFLKINSLELKHKNFNIWLLVMKCVCQLV